MFRIVSPGKNIKSARIYDLAGKGVFFREYNGDIDNVDIDISLNQQGIYFIRVEYTGGSFEVLKVVKL